MIEKNIFEKDEFKGIVIELENKQSLYVLVNDQCGWLMYLKYEGDVGFNSRNSEFEGVDDKIPFLLSNGQLDYYPKS